MAGTWQTIAGPDGRRLRVVDDGDPRGVPVLVHHGTPGAGLLHAPWADDAAARGIRLLSYHRPGYGESTRDAGRTVASAAADAAAIADALGFERFATWGASGGGPHALACAALLGSRVVACATIASVAPRVDGFDFLAGMGEGNVREFEAAIAGEAELRPLLERLGAGMLGDEAEELTEGDLESVFSPADAAVLARPLGVFLQESFRAGLAGGVDGWVDDDLAFVGPWGFDPGAIAVPVQVWQGRQDRMVPYEHGVWLARRLPRVDVRLSPDDGHLTLPERRVGEVHAFLRERF
ncbi:alpha/beta fold hydrolase [Candidatus Solirubrobacter pratensis]|uniref:alpha/beta fold hydrolase n=1 Tax=Candidatus Solirubrobacter pratensis TaxID=1298857 RepID=UPI000422BA6F|nr:alpha/beta fold hydrolase [Candidatus Solirubrobacter pratensis]